MAKKKHQEETKVRQLEAEARTAQRNVRYYQQELAKAEEAVLFEKQRFVNQPKARQCAQELGPSIVASIAKSPDEHGAYFWDAAHVNTLKSCRGLDRDRDMVPAVLEYLKHYESRVQVEPKNEFIAAAEFEDAPAFSNGSTDVFKLQWKCSK